MKHTILTLLLLAHATLSFSQVTGKVIDSKTREPLDYVNIYYEGKNVGDQTDEHRLFVIKEDSLWKELTVASMGYKTQVVRLKEFGKNQDITIKLVPDDKTLTGDTILTATFAIDQHMITIGELENGSVTGAGTYDYGTEVTLTATPEVSPRGRLKRYRLPTAICVSRMPPLLMFEKKHLITQ